MVSVPGAQWPLAEVGDPLRLGQLGPAAAGPSRCRLADAVGRHRRPHAHTLAERGVEADTLRLLGVRLAMCDVSAGGGPGW
ncbi:MAG TPA: hypothetical protein VH352_08075 [Pseudonocardiaceae bacterium]|nr:hypothetical protein [Pseudonocardiaceae bacterium]